MLAGYGLPHKIADLCNLIMATSSPHLKTPCRLPWHFLRRKSIRCRPHHYMAVNHRIWFVPYSAVSIHTGSYECLSYDDIMRTPVRTTSSLCILQSGPHAYHGVRMMRRHHTHNLGFQRQAFTYTLAVIGSLVAFVLVS